MTQISLANHAEVKIGPPTRWILWSCARCFTNLASCSLDPRAAIRACMKASPLSCFPWTSSNPLGQRDSAHHFAIVPARSPGLQWCAHRIWLCFNSLRIIWTGVSPWLTTTIIPSNWQIMCLNSPWTSHSRPFLTMDGPWMIHEWSMHDLWSISNHSNSNHYNGEWLF